ncbi:putative arabinosidase [Aspergillus pseudoustus]|uniref:Arabinosidase n=1 Tax=Aspergillus pseudoustus TaxID=1810923 RepID=A0ABR4IE23_9EURO
MIILSSLLAGLSILTGATGAVLPKPCPDEPYVGYLLSTFTDPDPRVFWHLSNASDPLGFAPLNGGEPVLGSTVGTEAVRDIFLTANADRSEYFIVATDLDINVPGFTWSSAVRWGSRGLVVWRSTNLVDWSEPVLSIIEAPEAGMAWAPSVIFNSTENQFYIFWASRLYSPTDTNHTGSPTGLNRIRYATTADFTTFSAPADYHALDTESIPLIDQEFLYLGEPGHYARFFKDETVAWVYEEISTSGIFGEWERVPGYVVESVYEGPAAFADVNVPGRYYLLLDNYGEYDAWQTDSIEAPGSWARAERELPGGLKHGNVFPITQMEWDGIVERFGV